MGKLVAAADHEGIEGVTGIQLRSAVPVETRLRWIGGSHRSKTSIVTNRRSGRIVLGGHELDVIETEAEIVDGFLDEVGVLVAGVAKFNSGHADKENASAGVAV